MKEKNESKDPKKGTGKKPKGSGRRLYTDEDPSDTVSVKFSTVQDIKDTLSKASFKSKSHKRQSQIINLIHQRVRVAKKRTKDPVKKKRLTAAFEYISKRKEASKRKTQRMKKENLNLEQIVFEELNSILDERCQKGYKTHPKRKTKKMYGKTYRNCIKAEQKTNDRLNLEELIKQEIVEYLEEKKKTDGKKSGDPGYNLRDWFKGGGWVQVGGKYDGKPCARQPGQKTKPYCRDADDRKGMSKKEKERRVKKKRKKDPNPDRKGKAINVSQKKRKKKK